MMNIFDLHDFCHWSGSIAGLVTSSCTPFQFIDYIIMKILLSMSGTCNLAYNPLLALHLL